MAIQNMNDVTITSLETIMAFDVVTGDYLFTLDELQNTTITNNEETQDITGRGGRLLNTLVTNKTVTVTGTNGTISGGLLSLQTGSPFENKQTTVKVPDILTVNNNQTVTTFTAVGTVGEEIAEVFIRNQDGSLGDRLTQGAATATDVFTYTPATKTITFNTGDIADGTEVAVFYFRRVQADVLENMSGTYAEKAQIYVDATAEDNCSNVFHIQFFFPRANFNGNFEIALGDTQAVHAFEFNSLMTACGLGRGQLWTYTIMGADAPDVP